MVAEHWLGIMAPALERGSPSRFPALRTLFVFVALFGVEAEPSCQPLGHATATCLAATDGSSMGFSQIGHWAAGSPTSVMGVRRIR
jgi:hypothetical protein